MKLDIFEAKDIENLEKHVIISILNLKPRDWGKGTEKTSEEIDKILY